jgi:formamidopyrimidine-DNA glycosylase
MPELPEVETIVRMLVPNVEGKRIEAAELRLGRMLLGLPPAEFPEALKPSGHDWAAHLLPSRVR